MPQACVPSGIAETPPAFIEVCIFIINELTLLSHEIMRFLWIEFKVSMQVIGFVLGRPIPLQKLVISYESFHI